MFQRLIATILLVCFAGFACGCYTLKNYSPQEVKPDWDIAYAVKTDSSVIRFDDEDPATIQGKMVVGGVRNEMSEVRPRRIPLDSVSLLRVRRPDTSTKALLVTGLGVGIAALVVVELVVHNRSKDAGGPPAPADSSRNW